MNKNFILFAILTLTSYLGFAQTNISGRILDEKAQPVRGASVYLENTLDGTTSDSLGNFKFETTESGSQTLVASAVGYSTAGSPLSIAGNIEGIELKLKNTARTLEDVTITAGAFEASNDKDKTVLKPLDIVTTAGAQADVVRAIETLPGTQKQSTENGLFVRGGDASEAAYIIDGLVVQNAFFSGPPGVATRSRFGAFQYKGVSFSSGGYSARYGQALSSVLELNSNDLPDKSTVNLGVNMAGVYASGSKLWKKSGGDITAHYNNLQPFYGIAKTNVDYYKVPEGGGGSARFAWQPNKNGLVKTSVAGTYFKSGIAVPNPYIAGSTVRYDLQNNNYTGNISYRQNYKSKFMTYAAAAYSYNKDQSKFDGYPGEQTEQRAQGRLEGKYFITSRLNVLAGGELQHITIDNKAGEIQKGFDENLIGGYAELEWTPVYWIAVKPGLRYEHSELIGQDAIAPRLALAIKAGANGQVSIATGIFHQNPDYTYLYLVKPYQLNFEFQKAVHYIINYQWQKQSRTLRIEGYYKDYQSLVLEKMGAGGYNPSIPVDTAIKYFGTQIDNSGTGYAGGAELFWRDKKTVKNLDYWVSYSYIDTRRLYKRFPEEATPEFISTHNLNVVGKYWIDKLHTQINATYSYGSGRPYYNPNSTGFLSDHAPDYHNFSVTVNYLRSFGKWFTVIYAGVDNITNQKNVFGYRYGSDGTRYEIKPALYRSCFVGVNFSLTEFDKDEL